MNARAGTRDIKIWKRHERNEIQWCILFVFLILPLLYALIVYCFAAGEISDLCYYSIEPSRCHGEHGSDRQSTQEDAMMTLLTFLGAVFYTYMVTLYVQRNNDIRKNMSYELEIIDRMALRFLNNQETNRKHDQRWYRFLLTYTGLVSEDWSINPSEFPIDIELLKPKSILNRYYQQICQDDDEQDVWKELVQCRADVGCRSEFTPFWSIVLLLITFAAAISIHHVGSPNTILEIAIMFIFMFTLMYLYDSAFITGLYGLHDAEAQRMMRQYFIVLVGLSVAHSNKSKIVNAFYSYMRTVKQRRVLYRLHRVCWHKATCWWINLWSGYDFGQAVMQDNNDRIRRLALTRYDADNGRAIGKDGGSFIEADNVLENLGIYKLWNRVIFPIIVAVAATVCCAAIYLPTQYIMSAWSNPFLFMGTFISAFISITIGALLISLFMRQDDNFLERYRGTLIVNEAEKVKLD